MITVMITQAISDFWKKIIKIKNHPWRLCIDRILFFNKDKHKLSLTPLFSSFHRIIQGLKFNFLYLAETLTTLTT